MPTLRMKREVKSEVAESRKRGAPKGSRNAMKGDAPRSMELRVRVTEDEMERLKARAARDGVTVAELVRGRIFDS